jgi:hypothetical protein
LLRRRNRTRGRQALDESRALVRVVDDQHQLPCLRELRQLFSESRLVMAHKAHIPGFLSLQPPGELERKPTLATTGGRGKKKNFSTGAERINDLGLADLISHEWTTVVDERAPWGIFEEGAIVNMRVDERLPFRLPCETVF